jgi:hypothetical protein
MDLNDLRPISVNLAGVTGMIVPCEFASNACRSS